MIISYIIVLIIGGRIQRRGGREWRRKWRGRRKWRCKRTSSNAAKEGDLIFRIFIKSAVRICYTWVENTDDRKRISANLSPNPNYNLKAQVFSNWKMTFFKKVCRYLMKPLQLLLQLNEFRYGQIFKWLFFNFKNLVY